MKSRDFASAETKLEPKRIAAGLSTTFVHGRKPQDQESNLTINTNRSKDFEAIPTFLETPFTRELDKTSQTSRTLSRRAINIGSTIPMGLRAFPNSSMHRSSNSTDMALLGTASSSPISCMSPNQTMAADLFVTAADISAIMVAWDIYVGLKENRGELKTVDQYHYVSQTIREGLSKENTGDFKSAHEVHKTLGTRHKPITLVV